MRRMISRRLVLIFIALGIAGCGGSSGGGSPPPPPAPTFSYSVPGDFADGWQVDDLANEGFDTQMIVAMMNNILDGTYPGIDSVTIARNNKLLLYWYDRDRELDEFDAWIGNQNSELHILHSTSKSVTSALIGIAIDQGHIASTDLPFLDLFSYASYENWDPRKSDITLEDALTMRFGFTWDEWSLPYTDPDNGLRQLNDNNFDWAKALLDLPMSDTPGTRFVYNTAGTNAIGQALENATGMSMTEFSDTYLFLPMQFRYTDWALSPTRLAIGGSGLYLTGRDLAKFGQLYLDGGVWQGQQLISADWVAASITRHVDFGGQFTYSEGYGYQWWLDEFRYQGQVLDVWATSGYGGQFTFVVPGLDLVVAFTGHNYTNSQGIANVFTMVESHIMAAIN